MSDFRFLNRCAVVVTPKTPFWDWVKKSGDIDEPLFTEVTNEERSRSDSINHFNIDGFAIRILYSLSCISS